MSDQDRIQTVKNELVSDPVGVGYASLGDVQAAESMNAGGRESDRESLSASLLAGAVDLDEYSQLSVKERAYFDLLISAGEVENTQIVRSQLRELFPAGSETRQKIRKALRRPATRGEELGIGHVTPSDIANARRL